MKSCFDCVIFDLLSLRYLRLKVDEDAAGLTVLSSNGRHQVMDRLGSPRTVGDVLEILSNDDDPDYPVFRRGTPKDFVLTIATGVFDFKRREWRMYVDRSKNSLPLAVFPMEI